MRRLQLSARLRQRRNPAPAPTQHTLGAFDPRDPRARGWSSHQRHPWRSFRCLGSARPPHPDCGDGSAGRSHWVDESDKRTRPLWSWSFTSHRTIKWPFQCVHVQRVSKESTGQDLCEVKCFRNAAVTSLSCVTSVRALNPVLLQSHQRPRNVTARFHRHHFSSVCEPLQTDTCRCELGV